MPKPVTLESLAAAVRLVNVEFDREALRLPVGVQLVTGNVEASGRCRQTRPVGELQEAALEA
jgi:hypothetical protein